MVTQKERRAIVQAIRVLQKAKYGHAKGSQRYKELSVLQRKLREKLYPLSARHDIQLRRDIKKGKKKIVKTGEKKYKVVETKPKKKPGPKPKKKRYY